MPCLPFIQVQESKLHVTAESIAFLESIKGPVGVVVIAGPYRTGKSFFINHCLLDPKSKSGFTVGGTVNACTKGIWMSTELITLPDCSVLVLDTEGIGAVDSDATHDSRIFSLALLLASYFIYNSVGAINESALSHLSLVVNITDHIQLQAGQTSSLDLLSRVFPHFLWVARDFSLQLVDSAGKPISAQRYLENALVGDDDVRTALRKAFPKRQCCTLVRPCNEESDLQLGAQLRPMFLKQAAQVRTSLRASIPAKLVHGQRISGAVLAGLAEAYVAAINSGAAPVLQDAWSLMAERQARHVVDELLVKVRKLDFADLHPERLADAVHAEHQQARATLDGGELSDSVRSRALAWLDTGLAQHRVDILQRAESRVEAAVAQRVMQLVESEQLGSRFRPEAERATTDLGEHGGALFRAQAAERLCQWSSKQQAAQQAEVKQLTGQIQAIEEQLTQTRAELDAAQHAAQTLARQHEEVQRALSESSASLTTARDEASRTQRSLEERLQDEQRLRQHDSEQVLQLHQQLMELQTSQAATLQALQTQLEEAEAKLLHAASETEQPAVEPAPLMAMQPPAPTHSTERDLVNATRTLLAKRESEFDSTLREFQNQSEALLKETRLQAQQDRTTLRDQLSTARDQLELARQQLQLTQAEMANLENDHVAKLEGLNGKHASALRTAEQLAEAAREEVGRLTRLLEKQTQLHREMVLGLEERWSESVRQTRLQADEAAQKQRGEQLSLVRSLSQKEVETQTLQAAVEHHKRKSLSLKEASQSKRLKNELQDTRTQLAVVQSELEWLRRSESELVQTRRDLEIQNQSLEAQCKDAAHQSELQLLKQQLVFEKMRAPQTS